MNDLSLLIGGSAGQGIESAGHMLGLNFARAGLHVFAMNEFCSQIRGGHNFHKVRVCDEEIFGHLDYSDIIVALNQETIDRHIDNIAEHGIVVCDTEDKIDKSKYERNVVFAEVPMKKIALDISGTKVMENSVALGFVLGLINFKPDILNEILNDRFSKKGEEIVKQNQDCVLAGFDMAREKFADKCSMRFERSDKKFLFLNGNDAICLGALKGGCKLVAEYPMTPSSSILHSMAAYARDYNIVVKHTEDEIAAANMLNGAAFAGVRCMTGTSGGGFALMTEGCGLAGCAELGIVIVNAQRPGPSTGLPTRTEQGDLRQMMHAGQGDYPRVVIAPATIAECFYETFRAFNIAERYQLPVFILSDKYLSEATKSVERFETAGLKIDRGKILDKPPVSYRRYEFTDDGISPRALPGTAYGIHRETGNEHDEYGNITEDPALRTRMMDKRMRKLSTLLDELDPPGLVGPPDADVTLVSWGSTMEACFAALPLLEKNGIKANILQIKYFIPFQKKEIADLLGRAKKKIGIEMNQSGQMAGVIRQETGIGMDDLILNYSGRPFTGLSVAEKVKNLL